MINKNPFYKLETEKIDLIRSEKIKPVLKELIKEKVSYLIFFGFAFILYMIKNKCICRESSKMTTT